MKKISELIPKGLSCSRYIEIDGEDQIRNFHIHLNCPFLITNLENGAVVNRCNLMKRPIQYLENHYLNKQCDINIPTMDDLNNLIFID